MEDGIEDGPIVTRIRRHTKSFNFIFDSPIYRYFRWNYYLNQGPKRFYKGTYLLAKATSFALIFLFSASSFNKLPPGMVLLIFLMGLLSLFYGIRSIYQFYMGYKYSRKSTILDQTSGKHSSLKQMLAVVIFLFLMAFFFFLIPQLQSPDRMDWPEHRLTWFPLYLTVFIIWSITAKAVIYAPIRAFKAGDRLARILHDRKVVSIDDRFKRQRKKVMLLMTSGLIPVIWLLLATFVSIAFWIGYAYLSRNTFSFGKDVSLGEILLMLVVHRGIYFVDMWHFLSLWYGKATLYSILILTVLFLSYIRTTFLMAGQKTIVYSPIGRKILTGLDLYDMKKERDKNKKRGENNGK